MASPSLRRLRRRQLSRQGSDIEKAATLMGTAVRLPISLLVG